MDWISALLLGLLASTLLAYFYGVFHYPYGVLILLALWVSRILLIKGKGK
jgi:predicted Co/Zn/Cd cation transporter (cation efflux family)